ncbi:hypothetical protein GEO21_22890 [Sphingobacterium faecium]|uniref:hypothetical protein n=1 Tax=Sphingobacterium faecium TaxID=34087 RepID=UPI001291883C|nr:hypothetical protein [Sphingobacterium faecium]MQP30331.1 hypothetical protein [Sphingobacterium faecium]
MNLNFFENNLRHTYGETDFLDFEADFIPNSVPLKARFKVVGGNNNTDIDYIDAVFGLNKVDYITSRGNVLKDGLAINVLEPWLISELRRNESNIYKDTTLLVKGEKSYQFEYKVLSDIEPNKIQFTYFDLLPSDEWTTIVETDGESLKHSGDVDKYNTFPFLKNYYDDFFVKKINEIQNFKKIKPY